MVDPGDALALNAILEATGNGRYDPDDRLFFGPKYQVWLCPDDRDRGGYLLRTPEKRDLGVLPAERRRQSESDKAGGVGGADRGDKRLARECRPPGVFLNEVDEIAQFPQWYLMVASRSLQRHRS